MGLQCSNIFLKTNQDKVSNSLEEVMKERSFNFIGRDVLEAIEKRYYVEAEELDRLVKQKKVGRGGLTNGHWAYKKFKNKQKRYFIITPAINKWCGIFENNVSSLFVDEELLVILSKKLLSTGAYFMAQDSSSSFIYKLYEAGREIKNFEYVAGEFLSINGFLPEEQKHYLNILANTTEGWERMLIEEGIVLYDWYYERFFQENDNDFYYKYNLGKSVHLAFEKTNFWDKFKRIK